MNIDGSYACGCNLGFELDSDERTCRGRYVDIFKLFINIIHFNTKMWTSVLETQIFVVISVPILLDRTTAAVTLGID
jgi:hypothetical protein